LSKIIKIFKKFLTEKFEKGGFRPFSPLVSSFMLYQTQKLVRWKKRTRWLTRFTITRIAKSL